MYSSDILEPNAPRRRRRYEPQFKAELVAHCQQRGISVASVAQDHGINANLLRRWIQGKRPPKAVLNRIAPSGE
ncbi:transposase [Pusillimonas sp. T7-7]|uniref:transposase n=1 Tax=Pusillimonas sp. (strain T7-7) TaxID=1007105 RepID=UPI001D175652|nr:transposase [Pusillimonas sp. T7-7]